MDQRKPESSSPSKNETPEWLKLIQTNSWEAELLISALLLYMLFQVPEFIENYGRQHYPRGFVGFIFQVFVTALKVLRVGYSLHIIARGIWVASVGLSSIYPKSINLEKLKFKNRFRKEIEEDEGLEKTIIGLEKIASLSYSISFMLSGMVISAGLLIVYVGLWQEFVINTGFESGNKFLIGLGVLGIFIYLVVLLILLIDFLTNGFFRRESWASKPFYYVAVTFRVLTLSFIFNRIYLTIISNLPRWQTYLVPILSIVVLIGYKYLENKIDDWDEERYLETAFGAVSNANYENLRSDGDPMFATIQSDIIYDGVVRLFVDTHGQVSQLYVKDDDYDRNKWSSLTNRQKSIFARKYMKVTVDGLLYDSLDWLDYVHPETYNTGFLNYINLSGLEKGLHTIIAELDTANFNELQKRFVREQDPVLVRYAEISFYKAH